MSIEYSYESAERGGAAAAQPTRTKKCETKAAHRSPNMRNVSRLGTVFGLVCGLSVAVAQDDGAKKASGGVKAAADSSSVKARRFQLEYGATLTKLPAGKTVRVWLPVPTSNDYQQVREVSRSLP